MDNIVTIKQQVYHIIKKRIANGTYEHGQRLQENDLAEDLMVSRSPVREALKQLVFEGVLEEFPNKGVYLRNFSGKDIRDIYDLRMILETYAIDYLVNNPTSFPLEELNNVRNCILSLEGDTIDYIVEPQINPHDAIVGATNNYYIIDFHRRASFYTMSYHNVLFQGENYNINIQQHLNIVDYLLQEDNLLYLDAVDNHLISSRDIICKAIREKSNQ